jgi:hypothetical protein
MPPVLTMMIQGVAALDLLTTSVAIATCTRLYMLLLDKNGVHDMQYVCGAHPNNVERFNAFRSFVIWVDTLGPGEASKASLRSHCVESICQTVPIQVSSEVQRSF